MPARLAFSGLLLSRLAVCEALSTAGIPFLSLENLLTEDLILWSVSLLTISAVLALAFWGFRKFNGTEGAIKDKLRVVGGLSLGMWEKIVLLQAGDRQLVLGVTPGRIQTLHVLEDDERLLKAEKAVAQKFKTEMSALTKGNPVSASGGKTVAELLGEAVTAASHTAGCEPALDKEDPLHFFNAQSYEEHLESVQRLVDQNPRLAAQTLKSWIRDE